MRHKLTFCFSLLLFFGLRLMNAQVVTLIPAFATQTDTVEVIFDASAGNGALVGVNPVYAHTGVITNLSTSPTDWRHVQGNWGTADTKVLMTSLGNNLHSLKFHINSFYNVPAGETVSKLAFVFRNQNGSVVGREFDGSDIFVNLSQGGFQALINTPLNFGIYDLSDTLTIQALSSDTADLSLYHGTTLLTQVNDTTGLSYQLPLQNYGSGRFDVVLQAVFNGNFHYDTISYLARSGYNVGVDPYNAEEGITILNDSSVFLKIRAPFKEFIYVIGDFNNWQVLPEYEMFITPDSKFFWLEIDGLQAGIEYAFQYYIDQEALTIADPYAEKILDPWNDQYISSSVYPGLKSYPYNNTDQIVSVFNTKETPYNWQTTNFEKPAAKDLIIYELLIRDFDSRHTYLSVIDRLPHLQKLGVNAIELMPVMEFEGNESWGYNPSFFMAPDKYYGTKNDLKILIDSCHARGIAVILDIAMNHAFGQSPMVRMYFDPSAGQWGQPSSQNPWFNEVPKHDFNVGYDFNHESEATKYFVKRVFQHWLEEYKIDGYRVDLSKGFTQKNTLGNIGAMAQYDQGRINILSRIRNNVLEVDSNAYVILEHFADNNEEQELASRGFLLWGNENHAYSEAAMGYSSNLSGILPQNRGFNTPSLVGYMESHDEERLMYKNLNFGNSNAAYDTRKPDTALQRMALSAAFFFTTPGPKMIWQFGEMGYDYSINRCTDGTINNNCRLSNKPIRWDYLHQPQRLKLTKIYSGLIWLRRLHTDIFTANNLQSSSLNSIVKKLVYYTGDSGVVVAGNFNVLPSNVSITFPENGWWYSYFSGDSIQINGVFDSTFAPGEYHIWTNFKPEEAKNTGLSKVEKKDFLAGIEIYPNPVEDVLKMNLPLNAGNCRLQIFSLNGKMLGSEEISGSREVEINCTGLTSGVYIYQLITPDKIFNGKFIKR